MTQTAFPLTALSEAQRTQALERLEIIRPALEKHVSQAQVARTHHLPPSTVQLWIKRYREKGLAGLANAVRSDKGESRRLPEQAITLVEGLALQTPPRSMAANQHHQGKEDFLVTRRFSHLIELLIVDEANRLKDAGLEQIRDMYDRGRFGLILLGMLGLEKRLAQAPQLYSRIGFAHQMDSLSEEETHFFLDQRWSHRVSAHSEDFTDQEAVATIFRITRGNMRLIERLMTQVEHISLKRFEESGVARVECPGCGRTWTLSPSGGVLHFKAHDKHKMDTPNTRRRWVRGEGETDWNRVGGESK